VVWNASVCALGFDPPERASAELEAAIHAYIDARNADPTPFQWIKSADHILASIERFCRRTLAFHAKVE
jgi:hypothetical protein